MSKVISVRLDDKVFDMLCYCYQIEKNKAASMQSENGCMYSVFAGTTKTEYTKVMLSNAIGKLYTELVNEKDS